MKTHIKLFTAVIITALAVTIFMSFRSTEDESKIALVKVYQDNTDFGNAIIIAYPGATVERTELLPNKHKNYEANDKAIQKALNSLTKLGYKLINVTNTNSGSILITQYIFQ